MDEETSQEPQKDQSLERVVVSKSFTRHHLPEEIIERIAKSVELELTKSPGESVTGQNGLPLPP
jgi:hypothetical protein